MARKSRKNLNVKKEDSDSNNVTPEEKHTLATAAYARLSVRNEERDNEESIKTQVMLIHEYIRNHPDLELEDTYVDYGFTGTNFDRPEFERMMKDVCTGRIQCIVVKDLSRFGRDYIETGHYLETIFPRLNVRFIAVTDDFDNFIPGDVESLAVPIKNLVNNLYVKDISHKIKSALRTRWDQDRVEKLYTRPPYGYVINEDKTEYIPEEGPADTVRVIFHWYLTGLSTSDIAKRLRLTGISSPSEQACEQGRWEARRVTDWSPSSVHGLLSCPSYAGDMVYHRTERSVEVDTISRPVDKKDWVIKKDYNEPIVLRKDMEEVQRIMEEKLAVSQSKVGKTGCKKEVGRCKNPFRYILRCDCCGKRMHIRHKRRKTPQGEETFDVYACDQPSCTNHNRELRADQLKAAVMDQICTFIETCRERADGIKKLMASEENESIFARLRKETDSLTGQIDQAEEKQEALYVDFKEGLLGSEEYQYMKKDYALGKQALTEELTGVREKYHSFERKANAYIQQADRLTQYSGCHEFNEDLVSELIDQVSVNKDKSIQVRFKGEDTYQELMKTFKEASDE